MGHDSRSRQVIFLYMSRAQIGKFGKYARCKEAINLKIKRGSCAVPSVKAIRGRKRGKVVAL